MAVQNTTEAQLTALQGERTIAPGKRRNETVGLSARRALLMHRDNPDAPAGIQLPPGYRVEVLLAGASSGTAPSWMCTYHVGSGAEWRKKSNAGSVNSATPVKVVAAQPSTSGRDNVLVHFLLDNPSNAAVVVTVRATDGTTTIRLRKATLQVDESLYFAPENGWAVLSDLTNYWYKPGVAGGVVAYGGTGSGENIELVSTSHATKGRELVNRLALKDAATNPTALGDFWRNSGAFKFYDTALRKLAPFKDETPADQSLAKYVSANAQWEAVALASLLAGAVDETALTAELQALVSAPKNLIINADGEYDQRNAGSNTSFVNDTYQSTDRFYSLHQAPGGASVQRVDAPSGFSCSYVQRLTSGTTSYRFGRATILEYRDVRRYRGWDCTAAIKVKATKNAGSGSIDVRYAVLEWTGTADAPTSDVVNDWTSSNYTAGNFFKSTTQNVLAVGSASVAHGTVSQINLNFTVGSSCNNLIAFVWAEDAPAHVSDYIEVGDWILTPGSVAPSIWVPRTLQDLALCQRYCWVPSLEGSTAGVGVVSVGIARNTTDSVHVLKPPVTLRARASSFVPSSGGHFNTLSGGSAVAVSTITLGGANDTVDALYFSVTASGAVAAAGDAVLLYANHSSAKITISSEL